MPTRAQHPNGVGEADLADEPQKTQDAEGVLGGGGQGLLGEGLAAYYNNGHSCDLFILNGTSDFQIARHFPRWGAYELLFASISGRVGSEGAQRFLSKRPSSPMRWNDEQV